MLRSFSACLLLAAAAFAHAENPEAKTQVGNEMKAILKALPAKIEYPRAPAPEGMPVIAARSRADGSGILVTLRDVQREGEAQREALVLAERLLDAMEPELPPAQSAYASSMPTGVVQLDSNQRENVVITRVVPIGETAQVSSGGGVKGRGGNSDPADHRKRLPPDTIGEPWHYVGKHLICGAHYSEGVYESTLCALVQ